MTRGPAERSGNHARPTRLHGTASEGRAFRRSTRSSPGRNRLSGGREIAEQAPAARDVASERLTTSSRDLEVSPRPWQDRRLRAAPAPAPKASSNAARMACADELLPTLSANSRDTLDASRRLTSPGGAGEIAFSVATEAGTVHDPFVPLQLRLYARSVAASRLSVYALSIFLWQIVPVVIAVDLPEMGRHVAILRSARLRPQPVQLGLGSGKKS